MQAIARSMKGLQEPRVAGRVATRAQCRLPLQGSFLPVKTVKTFSNEKTCKLRTDVVIARAAKDTGNEKPEAGIALFGEDAAAFSLEQQSLSSWVKFFGVLGVVSVILYAVWIQPGAGLADDYVAFLKSFSDNPEVVILEILLLFAIVHSGLAGLRPQGEQLIGERAYRVLFASASLPLAVVAVMYFINHRYSGTPLWNLRSVPGVHEAVWIMSLVSFFFLYPSTFNLLEVAAVDKPKLHMWETGIMRVTRHPQAWGQLLWCFAHCLWIGNSFMVTTSIGLMAHHLFGCWHGDRRLEAKYGNAFLEVKARTSILPFQAILEGRQQLPDDYWKEFVRVPYLAVIIFSVGAYLSHPLLQRASYWLNW